MPYLETAPVSEFVCGRGLACSAAETGAGEKTVIKSAQNNAIICPRRTRRGQVHSVHCRRSTRSVDHDVHSEHRSHSDRSEEGRVGSELKKHARGRAAREMQGWYTENNANIELLQQYACTRHIHSLVDVAPQREAAVDGFTPE